MKNRLFIICVVIGYMTTFGRGPVRAQKMALVGFSAADYSNYISVKFADSHKRTLIFLLRLRDFDCGPCLSDLLDFCDSLDAMEMRGRDNNIAFFFSSDSNGRSRQMRLLKEWGNGNGVRYPIYVIPGEVLRRNHIEHSSVIFFEEGNRIELFSQIPISADMKRQFLRRLTE